MAASEQTPLTKWAWIIDHARGVDGGTPIVELAEYAAKLEAQLADLQAQTWQEPTPEQRAWQAEAELAEARGGEWEPVMSREIKIGPAAIRFVNLGYGELIEIHMPEWGAATEMPRDLRLCRRRPSQPEPITQEAADQERTAAAWPKTKVIKTETEYEAALAYVDTLMEAELDSPEEEQLELFALLVEDYEKRHYPISLPAQWPSGEQAAEELARARYAVNFAGYLDAPAWEKTSAGVRALRIKEEAAVLARLQPAPDAKEGE